MRPQLISQGRVSPPSEPRAEQRPRVRILHGVRLTDEFAWLKAANWQEVMRDPQKLDPAIRAYLRAENDYCERALADTAALQATLFAEMKGRIKEDDSTVPDPDGPHAYYVRYRKDGQHPLLCREPRNPPSLPPPQAGEGRMGKHLLLDADALASGKPFFRLGATRHSPDHRLLAWTADETGSELYTARVRVIETGADLADAVPDVSGAVVWTQDASAFYYVRLDQNHRPDGVFRHRLGTPASADARVFAEPDPGLFLSVGRNASGRFRRHFGTRSRDVGSAGSSILPCPTPNRRSSPRAKPASSTKSSIIRPSTAGRRSSSSPTPTAPKTSRSSGRRLRRPAAAHWRDLVPHRHGVYVLSFRCLSDWLIRLEREDGLPRIVVRALRAGEEHVDRVRRGSLFARHRRRLRVRHRSLALLLFVDDDAVRSLGLRSGDRARAGCASARKSRAATTRPITSRGACSRRRGRRDRSRFRFFIARTWSRDGSAPCLLYGYGAYGLSIPAAFSTNRLSLVDRGFVFAIAHVRGGTEKGWRWYREGKLAKKQNTFTRLHRGSRVPRARAVGAPTRLVAQGGSAGGLLIGAVANMRPDLFAGLIAEVPFVDVLNTMLDETLPLTPPEWPEWGNPIPTPRRSATILAYSPYENVRAQDYPAILALAGLTDPRVSYWEPAKWIARLRRLRTDDSLIALRTNLEAGHAGAAGRFDRLKEVALAYAFAIKVAGGTL